MPKLADAYLHKTVNESRPFNFDWERELASGEVITTATVTSTPAGLTIGTPTTQDAVVQIRVSGGSAATVYSVTCKIDTNQGNTLELCGKLEVINACA